MSEDAPNPEAARFLQLAQSEASGRLTVYLGSAPGVGKTYRMLQEAGARKMEGADVVAGVVETHGRAETAALLKPLETLPRLQLEHAGHQLAEFDIEAALVRHPDLILIDELAHTNAPGSRHSKRWQDVVALIEAGINVATTLNIQHIESLNDVVAGFTHIRVRETVPDAVLDHAEMIFVDLPPEELIARLHAGKVYLPQTAGQALANFFTPNKLAALRELALRFAARSVDRRLHDQLAISGENSNFTAGERLMVAIGPGAASAQIIRQAKRMADLFHAQWTVVLVESSQARAIQGEERERLGDTLALASSLGANLLTVAADDIARAIVEQARELRASLIVIGQTRRSKWFEWWHGSIPKKVLRHAHDLPVHIVPLESQSGDDSRKINALARRDNLLALAAIASTVALLLLAQPVLPFGAIDLLFLVPVIVCSTLLRFRAGLWSAVMAALAYNFFFIPPLYTFTIESPQNLVTFGALALVAFVVGGLAGRVKRQAQTSAGVARLNASLARFAGLMGAISDKDETARVACREIGSLLDVEAIIVAREQENLVIRGNPRFSRLDMVDEAAVRWAFDNGIPTGRDTGTLNAADWQYHPLRTTLGTMAVLGLARPSQQRVIRPDDTTLLASLVDQTALAHERLVLEGNAREVDALHERDRLRGALLSSIAHDLRTPLTAVIAATDAIPEQALFAEELSIARSESRRLARFLNDLLEASRIEEGAIEPRFESVDLADVVNAVVRDLRHDGARERIQLELDMDCPLVRTDPVLLRHALLNLFDNALKYSPRSEKVMVRLQVEDKNAELCVLDSGPGLPKESEILFKRFHRIEGSDRTGGSGLGLWIARNFTEALGCVLTAENRMTGGACFAISIPLLQSS